MGKASLLQLSSDIHIHGSDDYPDEFTDVKVDSERDKEPPVELVVSDFSDERASGEAEEHRSPSQALAAHQSVSVQSASGEAHEEAAKSPSPPPQSIGERMVEVQKRQGHT